MIVLLDDICCIIENPVTSIKGSESHSQCDSPSAINPRPNVKAVTAITRPRPTIVLRAASVIALISAPIPDAPVRKPSVCGPPCRMSLAKTGSKTEYGTPTRLTHISRSRIDRMGVKLET